MMSLTVSLAQDELIVQTTGGPVQGYWNEVGIKTWKGIPYAKPPVGDLRWQYPQAPEVFTEPYNATFDAPGCAQVCKLPPGNCPEYGVSEVLETTVHLQLFG